MIRWGHNYVRMHCYIPMINWQKISIFNYMKYSYYRCLHKWRKKSYWSILAFCPWFGVPTQFCFSIDYINGVNGRARGIRTLFPFPSISVSLLYIFSLLNSRTPLSCLISIGGLFSSLSQNTIKYYDYSLHGSYNTYSCQQGFYLLLFEPKDAISRFLHHCYKFFFNFFCWNI